MISIFDTTAGQSLFVDMGDLSMGLWTKRVSVIVFFIRENVGGFDDTHRVVLVQFSRRI